MRTHRGYLVVWFAIVGLGLGAAATVSAVVDPFRLFWLPVSERYRPYDMTESRVLKQRVFDHAHFSTIVLGSSRSQRSINPDARYWGAEQGNVVNLSLPGTDMNEIRTVFDYVLAHGRPRRVVLTLDFVTFAGDPNPGTDWKASRFNPELNVIDFWLGNVFSRNALNMADEVAGQASRHRPSRVTDRGFTRLGKLRVFNHRWEMRMAITTLLRNPYAYKDYRFGPERIRAVADVIERCRERDIELVLAIHPVHAMLLNAIYMRGLEDEYLGWKRGLVEVVAADAERHPDLPPLKLWDFATFNDYSREPFPPGGVVDQPMKWWMECSHCKAALGRIMMRRVLGLERDEDAVDPEFGVVLTPENIDERCALHVAERHRFLREHPAELEWLRAIRRILEHDFGFETLNPDEG